MRMIRWWPVWLNMQRARSWSGSLGLRVCQPDRRRSTRQQQTRIAARFVVSGWCLVGCFMGTLVTIVAQEVTLLGHSRILLLQVWGRLGPRGHSLRWL